MLSKAEIDECANPNVPLSQERTEQLCEMARLYRETTFEPDKLRWVLLVADTEDLEIQTLSALAEAMERNDLPEGAVRRIAIWFFEKYGR